jgi:hypothetical protein
MHQPSWFKTDRDLVVGDLVYFAKSYSAVGDAKWRMGMVQERAVRKLIKIFSMEETNLTEDLAELSKKMKFMKTPDNSLVDLDDITAQVFIAKPEGCKSKRALQGECCCKEHCTLAMH